VQATPITQKAEYKGALTGFDAIFPDRAVSLACFRESFPCSLE
jgi:hypothetical protein